MLRMRVAVSVLVIIQMIDDSVSLRPGDPGVIEQIIPATNNEPQKVELICDHNYEFDMGTDSCVPFVDESEIPKCSSCIHGKCVGPEICECFEGYNKTNEGCSPICFKPCINGYCAAPDNCSCNPGYEKTKDGCIPLCSSPCTNGYCSAPNICTCDPGYHKTEEEDDCKPVCSPPCLNGYCSGPNNCTCNMGYHKTKEGCKPVCSSHCLNGYCASPNNCSCNKGYLKELEECKPVCSKPCTNGYCTAPDYCTCNKGYIARETDYSICYKPCLTPCNNGSCDLDGICICFAGFEFDNDTHTCIPIKPISCFECLGNCTAEKDCRCADGTPCYNNMEFPPEPQPVNMAGLDLTIISIGSACLLLFIVIVVVMQRIWQKRHKYENKSTTSKPVFGSVVYTVPNTLIQSRVNEDDNEGSCEDDTNNTLLQDEAQIP